MNRYALCIGNDSYEHLMPLSCAVSDAEAIANKLGTLGFDVDVKINLSRESLNKAVTSLADRLEEYDAVLLYYAGHGFQVEGTNILAPIDLSVNDDMRTVRYNAFPVDDLMKLLNSHTAKTKVIILDACRSALGSRGQNNNFSPMFAPQGAIIAFSTSPNQSAKERDGHGLYTNALLRYMDLPRVPIETVFKRVRTALANETHGSQIPWEHTSLIGEFYLNPDTIYDGVVYGGDAYADGRFVFARGSKIGEIVEGLKSHTWPIQEKAVKKLHQVDYISASAGELFVLGRNLYQAACGNSYAVRSFIERFPVVAYIPDKARLHMLNGMAFEIYYDHEGRLRRNFKTEYAGEVIKLLEKAEFYGSCEFIASCLRKEETALFYIPGQNEKVDVTVKVQKTDKGVPVNDILYNGISIYYNVYGDKKAVVSEGFKESNKRKFELELEEKMAIMRGYLNVTYSGAEVTDKVALLLPFNGYQLFPREEDE